MHSFIASESQQWGDNNINNNRNNNNHARVKEGVAGNISWHQTNASLQVNIWHSTFNDKLSFIHPCEIIKVHTQDSHARTHTQQYSGIGKPREKHRFLSEGFGGSEKSHLWCKVCWWKQALYLDWVYLVTALVPSDTACLASSPGSSSLTAVWISLLVMVERLL